MKLYEYQAKEILKGYDGHIARGIVAHTPQEAQEAFERLGVPQVILKAQILAGGRGKAGGVGVAKDPEGVRLFAEKLLGSRLLTAQTGPEGEEVKALLVQEFVPAERELYIALLVDRREACPLLMGCPEGGVEIEEIAQSSPELIFKEPLDISSGLHPFQARRMASTLGLSGASLKDATTIMINLSKAFIEKDFSLLEINPLILTPEGPLSIVDVKATLDDNASFRHPESLGIRPPGDSLEALASSYGLSYVALEGDIGCLVNGAGLAMATMDIIRHCGGRPANFLDVGGDASTERIAHAFCLLLEDTRLKAILVNIFGGIVRCDYIAQAIIEALKEKGPKIPLVVRLEGTNAPLARTMLEDSGLEVIFSRGMQEAAVKVLEAVEQCPH